MKCKKCGKEIAGKPAYYKKDPVHPTCYKDFKDKKQRPTKKTKPSWLNKSNYSKSKK